MTTFVTMKKLLYLIFPIVLIGCDDGDIITNDFDFEDSSVEACDPTLVTGSVNNYVFYKNENTNFESLVLQFRTANDILNVDGTYGPYTITSSNSNTFEYRKFNAAPGNDYYCNSIPPSSPMVTEVYTAMAGNVIVETGTRSDDDNDGIPAAAEGAVFIAGVIDPMSSQDSDGDGIPDYLDSDDDGDNVPTDQEGVVLATNGSVNVAASRDTDGDGTPDYLDTDDDGDGVLSRNESIDSDIDPTNDIALGSTIPNYRDAAIDEEANPIIEEYIEHTIQRITQVRISISNLSLQNDREEIVFETYPFGDFLKEAVQLSCTPTFPAPTSSGGCIFQ